MNAKQLKITALICMITDHIASFAIAASTALYTVLRFVGRMAFPIYCFLLAEGDSHTKSRPRYIGRLLLLAVISEPIYDWFFSGGINLHEQNVFFTLLIGELVLTGFATAKKINWKRFPKVTTVFWMTVITAMGYIVAELIECDYGGSGIVLMVLFSILWVGKEKLERQIGMMITCAIMFVLWIDMPFQLLAILSIIFLLPLYNGRRGNQKHPIIYYMLYPIHMAVIGLVCGLLL